MVCWHIKSQDYLSLTWKSIVVTSSAFLLGPTAIYLYSIHLIISFKLRSHDAPTSAYRMTEILNKASFLASRAKLGEIFFESIPQFLTQILMTSGKGESGVRELTFLQRVSVMSSAISIAFGVSKFGVREGGSYFSKNHSKMTSYLVLIIFGLSEIAFCGGLCRFSFAFKIGETYPIPILIPFVAVSSGLSLAPIVSDHFDFRRAEVFLLIIKLCVWITIIGIFFSQWHQIDRVQDLINNNSIIIFFVTMTMTSVVNFSLGFFIYRHRASLKAYTWMDLFLKKVASSLQKLANSLTVRINSETDKSKLSHESLTASDYSEKHTSEKIQNKDVPWQEEATISKVTKPFQLTSRTQTLKRCCSWGILLVSFLLPVFSAIIALFMSRVIEQPGYHAEFYHDCIYKKSNFTGFPVVSASENMTKGSICVHNRSPLEMVKIGKVFARQIQGNTSLDTLLFVDKLNYKGIFPQDNIEALESPFLEPLCNGTEKNLIYCKQYGLNVGISKACSKPSQHNFFGGLRKKKNSQHRRKLVKQ